MKFSSFCLKLSSFASKLMGISTPAKSTSKVAGLWADTKTVVGITFENLPLYIGNAILDIGTFMIEWLFRFVYAVVRWILVSIDFIFIFIRQMVGMDTDFSNIESLSESDMIFQFVFNENVLRIMRALIGLAIILLVLFCIFAIIKSEYDFIANGGKDGNSKKKILVNTLKSLFLMAFVPLVAIGGIFMSNAILSAVYNATSGGSDTSIGSQIFLASTYDANAYRLYANRNLKRPITFNFDEITEESDIKEYYTDGTVAEAEEALNAFKSQSVLERSLKTYYMFANKTFLSMDDVDGLDRVYSQFDDVSPYHTVYDANLYSRREQYYIMADVVDYSISRNRAVYFKTMEDVYESYFEVYNKVSSTAKSDMIFTDSGSFPITYANDKYYATVKYEGDNEATIFTHTKGRKDEAKEAVFIIALEKTVKDGDKTYTYYYPLLNAKDNFATDYYQGKENIVIAKGLFSEGENPTAIREKDGIVEFYRDEINAPVLLDLFPKISYELPEGATEELGTKLLKAGISALTGVDISQFIPYIYFNIDVFHLFKKEQYSIAKVENGYFKVDYNFSQKAVDKTNVYVIREINPVILILASALMINMLLKILFGIAFRTLDLFMLILTYPAVLASMPLTGGGSFKSWTESFVKKLLSIYGVVVGVNVVLILVPVMEQVQLFTTADIQAAINVGELAASASASMLNFFMRIMFILVALSSIQPFIVAISQMLGFVEMTELSDKDKKAGKKEEVILLKEGDAVIGGVNNAIATAGKVVSGAYFIDKANEVMDYAVKFAMPGKAIVDEGVKGIQGFVSAGKDKKSNIDRIKEEIENVKKTVNATQNERDYKAGKLPTAPGADSNGGAGNGGQSGNNGGNDANPTLDEDSKKIIAEDNPEIMKEAIKEEVEEEQNDTVTDGDGVNKELEKGNDTDNDADKDSENKDKDDQGQDASKKDENKKDSDTDEDANKGNDENTDAENDKDDEGDNSADKSNETNIASPGEFDPRDKKTIKAEQKAEKAKAKAMKKAEKQTAKANAAKAKAEKQAKKKAEKEEKRSKSKYWIRRRKRQEARKARREQKREEKAKKEKYNNHTGLKIIGGIGKTAGKFAFGLTKIAGKAALGLTKTALKMTKRVVKTTASSLWKLANGQSLGKTLFQIGGGVFVAGMEGVGGITKTGLKLGKDLTVASAKTAGGLIKSFGSPILQGRRLKKQKELDEKAEAEEKKKQEETSADVIPEAPEVPQIKEEQKIPETENPTVKADEQNNGEMKKPVKPEQQPSQKPKTVHDGRKPLEISGKQLSKVSKRAKARRKLKARKKK